MKAHSILLVFLSLLQTISVSAQQGLHAPWRSVFHTQAANIISNEKRVPGRRAKPTSVLAERLVATSVYNITDSTLSAGMIDSSHYKYSASRSSTFDYTHMIFNPAYFIMADYIMGFGANIGYHNHNNNPSILFDTSRHWSYSFSPIYLTDTFWMDDVTYASYDSSYNVTEYADLHYLDSTAYFDDSRFLNTFDAAGNLTSSIAFRWNMGIWDTTGIRLLSYDTLNNVIDDSVKLYSGGGTWYLMEEWTYTYDDSGNIINAVAYSDSAGIWAESERIYMRYNSANQLQWDSVSQYIGGWVPHNVDTIGYTSGIDYAVYLRSLSYGSSGTPGSYTYFTKHLDVGGLPDTLYTASIYYSDSVIDNKTKTYFQYDSYNEPTIAVDYNFYIDTPGYTTGWYDTVASRVTHYYYETYYPRHASSINEHSVAGVNVKFFPNPTQDRVNIQIAKGTITHALIKIINSSGQLVRTESFPWLHDTESISMGGLIPGVYWVVVLDNNGNVLGRQAVVKQ